MPILRLLAILSLCHLSACASILSGRTQTMTIESNPPGAACDLSREGRVIGNVATTPGALMVTKTKYDINLVCRKPEYHDSTAFIDSGLDGAVWGNILLGGLIGWGVDSAVGADNKYAEVTTVTMIPLGNQEPASSQDFALQDSSREQESSLSGDPKSIEKRLQSLEKLKSKGIINNADYQKARQKILADI